MEIYSDERHRLTWGTDAGLYKLISKKVVRLESKADVTAILESASLQKTPTTFRAAGTILSGQAVSDSLHAVAGKWWTAFPYGKEVGPSHWSQGLWTRGEIQYWPHTAASSAQTRNQSQAAWSKAS